MRTALLTLLSAVLAVSSGAQELSSDGRSEVGRTTSLDRLVRFLDPDRLLIGLSSDELKVNGERLYPQEGRLHNRAGHRLGSRILTDRFGAVGATALGVANEIFEAYNLRHTGAPVISTKRFDLGDLAANLRGVFDSYAADLNTPWGLVWCLCRYAEIPLTVPDIDALFGLDSRSPGGPSLPARATEVRPDGEPRLPHRRDVPHARADPRHVPARTRQRSCAASRRAAASTSTLAVPAGALRSREAVSAPRGAAAP